MKAVNPEYADEMLSFLQILQNDYVILQRKIEATLEELKKKIEELKQIRASGYAPD